MSADQWTWIVVANILLGLNQGLAWSATVVMKIDLVGERQRGFAMGLNEFAGYLAVALVAFLTGYIASHYGIRPYPFYIGILLVVLGLLFSIFLVRDTRKHVELEAKDHPVPRLEKCFGIRRSGIETWARSRKQVWSTTSTTGWPGDSCQSCLQAKASASPPLARSRRSTLPFGASRNCLPEKCRIGFVRRVCCTGVCSVRELRCYCWSWQTPFSVHLAFNSTRLGNRPRLPHLSRNSRGEYPPTGPSRKPWRIPALARHGLRDRSLTDRSDR